jgi:hypothetical protein
MVIHDMRNPTNSIEYALKEVIKVLKFDSLKLERINTEERRSRRQPKSLHLKADNDAEIKGLSIGVPIVKNSSGVKH